MYSLNSLKNPLALEIYPYDNTFHIGVNIPKHLFKLSRKTNCFIHVAKCYFLEL